MIPRSRRNDNNNVEFSIFAEDELRRILGETMLYLHGNRNNYRWKNILIRIYRALQMSINMNLHSDNFHLNRIQRYMKIINQSILSKENEEVEIIICLSCIMFEILGRLPDNRQRKILNRKDEFLLNGLRDLTYTQNPSQRVNTILEASRYEPYCNYHKYQELDEAFWYECDGSYSKFLKWYKTKHGNVYLMLF